MNCFSRLVVCGMSLVSVGLVAEARSGHPGHRGAGRGGSVRPAPAPVRHHAPAPRPHHPPHVYRPPARPVPVARPHHPPAPHRHGHVYPPARPPRHHHVGPRPWASAWVAYHPTSRYPGRCWRDVWGNVSCRYATYSNGCVWDDWAGDWDCSPILYNRPVATYSYRATCAPEVQEGNLKAVDRVLTELAASEEFRDASKFQNVVAQAPRFETQEKVARYFGYLGIDSANSAEVARLFETRGNDPQVVSEVERRLELNREQAEKVVVGIRSALLGDLE